MTVSTRNSILDPKTFGNQGSRITDRRSKIENHGSKIEDRESRIEDRDSRFENRKSRFENRKSRFENLESGTENWGSRSKDQISKRSQSLTCSLSFFWYTYSLIFLDLRVPGVIFLRILMNFPCCIFRQPCLIGTSVK